MSKFNPEFYRQYRPFYPAELFAELSQQLERRKFSQPYVIADVGCGTGHSTASLIRSMSCSVTGVDPDPLMLAQAKTLPELVSAPVNWQVGSGESTGLSDGGFAAVTVGSAFHWMKATEARDEFLRILMPSGLILVYEYQFPKCAALPELNEWVRREFNLRWKAPGQKPRGDFETVTRCFREDHRLERIIDRKVSMILPLGSEDLSGLIFSQSRVLHYENEMTSFEREAFHKSVRAQVGTLMKGRRWDFDFSLQAALFGRK